MTTATLTTSDERERLGVVAWRAHDRALIDVPWMGGRALPEVWRRTADAIAGPLLTELAELRARLAAAEKELGRSRSDLQTLRDDHAKAKIDRDSARAELRRIKAESRIASPWAPEDLP